MKNKLSDLKVRKAAPKAGQYDLGDGNGLFLRVYPSGTKVWFSRFTCNNSQKSVKLGAYPDLGLSEARAKNITLKESAATDARRLTSILDIKVKDVINDFLAYKKARVGHGTYCANTYLCNKWILPTLGDINFHQLQAFHIRPIIAKMAIEAPTSSLTLCGFIARVERFAMASGVIDCLKLQNLNVFTPVYHACHYPSVPATDLPMVLGKLDLASNTQQLTHDLILMQACTLLRSTEVSSLKWDWIDREENCIAIPGDFMKMKNAHRVPISTQIQTLLDRIPIQGEFMFPSPRLPGSHLLKRVISQYFTTHGLRGIIVPHGLRSMGRTWLSDIGTDFFVAESCLAHKVGNQMQRAYLRTDFLEQRREPMQRWNDYVSHCLKQAYPDKNIL